MVAVSTPRLVFSKCQPLSRRHDSTSAIQHAKRLAFNPCRIGHSGAFLITPGLPAYMSRTKGRPTVKNTAVSHKGSASSCATRRLIVVLIYAGSLVAPSASPGLELKEQTQRTWGCVPPGHQFTGGVPDTLSLGRPVARASSAGSRR
jgi:hypothetical protein